MIDPAAPVDAAEPPPLEEPRRSRGRTVLALVALVALLALVLIPAPYVIERPGPVFDTLGSTAVDGKGAKTPIIRISGRATYPTTGRLDALTVTAVGTPDEAPSWLELARAWFDPSQTVVPVDELYAPHVSDAAADAESAAEMKNSQQSATAAALTALRIPLTSDLAVTEVARGSAAQGVLRTGDVVRSVNGRPIVDICGLQDAVIANGSGRTATIAITRAGTARTVHVTPRSTDEDGVTRPVVGVVTSGSYRFPFPVSLQLSDVGGPSAGMMFALGIIDRLTPGALTGGRNVAGTGTICADGAVGPIGGIRQKMYAARSAGATVFLAPASNCDEVAGHIPSGLTVLAVRTLQQSLADLKVVAKGSSTRNLPSCGAG